MKNILLVATNVDCYENQPIKTGLWLSEITHIYYLASENGYKITIASPNGGNIPLDPESLKLFMSDKLSRNYLEDSKFMRLLQNSLKLADVIYRAFDCVYLSGGHATMYDFPDDKNLQTIIRNNYEIGNIVAAVCHGVGGLLNVKLSNENYLVDGKKLTGFSWLEESFARRKNAVPFNLEQELISRGALYSKAFLPMTSYTIADANLITGQNPFSSNELAKAIILKLERG